MVAEDFKAAIDQLQGVEAALAAEKAVVREQDRENKALSAKVAEYERERALVSERARHLALGMEIVWGKQGSHWYTKWLLWTSAVLGFLLWFLALSLPKPVGFVLFPLAWIPGVTAFLLIMIHNVKRAHAIVVDRIVDQDAPDVRHESVAIRDLKFEPVLIEFTYFPKPNFWQLALDFLREWMEFRKGELFQSLMPKPKRGVASAELLCQLTGPDIMKMDRDEATVWTSMNAAAGRVAVVNVSKYAVLQGKFEYQDTVLLSFALYRQMSERLKSDFGACLPA